IRDRNVTGVQTCALPILIQPTGPPNKRNALVSKPTFAAPVPAVPPAKPNPLVKGAKNFNNSPIPKEILEIVPPKIPNPVKTGPIATATTLPNSRNLFIILCTESGNLSYESLMALNFSINSANTLPNRIPHNSAVSPIPSNASVKSPINGFNWLKNPPPFPPASRNEAPNLPTAAHIFASAAVNDFSPIIL